MYRTGIFENNFFLTMVLGSGTKEIMSLKELFNQYR